MPVTRTARHSSRGTTWHHGGKRRSPRLDEQPVWPSAPRHQTAKHFFGLQSHKSGGLRPGQGLARDDRDGNRRSHAGLRRSGDFRRLCQPFLRSIQLGNRLPRIAHGPTSVCRHERAPIDYATRAGQAQSGLPSTRGPTQYRAGSIQEPG